MNTLASGTEAAPIPQMGDIFKLMVHHKSSDLFVNPHFPIAMKVNGVLRPITKQPITPNNSRDLVLSLMNPKNREIFEKTKECNFAVHQAGVGRFRISAYYQRDCVSMVVRRIETKIPSMEELHLPLVLKDLAMTKRGIIIFVGATGTGKTTSLASMIKFRNDNSTGHIITIEDPIEFYHPHSGCVVSQREVGVDTESWEVALKNTLRQAPDVILIGEVRTTETMEHAIAFAETGHLVLCTLHANNANQAIDRIINFFPDEKKKQVLMDLSLNLKAIVAQQLIPTVDGKSRRAALEILIKSPSIEEKIREGLIPEIKKLMAESANSGMKTFDQSLFELYIEGAIGFEDAIRHADSANDLRLKIKLSQGNANDTGGLRNAEIT